MISQVARRRRDYVSPMPISRHNRRRDGIDSLRKIDIAIGERSGWNIGQRLPDVNRTDAECRHISDGSLSRQP